MWHTGDMAPDAPVRPTPAGGIVIFDGSCAFCDGAVRFIARHDPAGHFRFGASQSPRAAVLLAAHRLTDEPSRSLVLIEDGEVSLRSTAALRIARRLAFPYNVLGFLLVVPRPLRDLVYRAVAAVRHRLAGRIDACALPSLEIRSRLL